MESIGLMFVGIAAAIVLPVALICAVAIWFCWRGIQKTKQQSQELRKARLVDIKDLKNGLHKIEGQIRAQDDLLRSPLAKKKCVYFRFHVEELRSTGHGRNHRTTWVTVVNDKQWIDFNIDDGTGEVEINLETAEVALHSKAFTSSGTFDGASPELEELMNRRYRKSTKGWLFNKSMRYTETWLRDGDTVMIVGDVKKTKGMSPEFYKGDHHLLLTDMDEEEVGTMYAGRATGYWFGLVFAAFFMFVFCGAGTVFGVIGGGIGIFGPKVPEIVHKEFPIPKDNPFERDRKKIEQKPVINKDELKPRPINPAWKDAAMTITWLSDLKEENVRVGWGKFGKNGMMGYKPNGAPNEDAPVLMDGKPFTKSISFHPPDFGESVVQYRLNRQHKLLKAMVCLADMPANVKGAASPQTFKVFGDGELLWKSQPPIQQRNDRQSCRISVENVDTLELRVQCAGGKVYAWAVWINPQLLK